MTPEQIRDAARVNYDRNLLKQNLHVQMTSRLSVTHNDGVFTANQNLISFLASWPQDELVLLDDYKTPVLIDRLQLLAKLQQRYQETLNQWLEQYNTQSQVRNARQL
jgi:hypothetical protein